MKQLNKYYLEEHEPDIPDGKTVEPTDDIQIWIHCAGRKDAYTSLADVLADSACLAALMADDNAVDYLVRSTTWTTMCSNLDAMAEIGANNYAANTLLDDSTWRTAICGSIYYASVLNASVPTMTSDTTPYGTVFYSGQDPDWKGWKAFATGAWVPTRDQAPCWLGYQFTSAVKIVKASIKLDYGQNPTYKIQGSNDGVAYTDLASLSFVSIAGSQTKTITFANTMTYKYYRIYSTTALFGGGRTTAYTGPVQFYGRKDI